MRYEVLNTLLLLLVSLAITVAYVFRVLLRGRAHFDRVNRQGGSVLLSKIFMEMAYWGLQPVARFFVVLGLSPNFISWGSLVFGGVAGVFLASGYFGTAAVMATISAFLDALDGMVARMTQVASDAGEVLDAAVDRYVEFFFLAGLVLYYRHEPIWQLVALFAMIGSFMVSYSTSKAEALHIPPPPGIMRRPERAFYLTLGAAFTPMTIAWWETFSVSPIGYPMVAALCFVALLSNIAAIERFYTIAHEMRLREAEDHLRSNGNILAPPHHFFSSKEEA